MNFINRFHIIVCFIYVAEKFYLELSDVNNQHWVLAVVPIDLEHEPGQGQSMPRIVENESEISVMVSRLQNFTS